MRWKREIRLQSDIQEYLSFSQFVSVIDSVPGGKRDHRDLFKIVFVLRWSYEVHLDFVKNLDFNRKWKFIIGLCFDSVLFRWNKKKQQNVCQASCFPSNTFQLKFNDFQCSKIIIKLFY